MVVAAFGMMIPAAGAQSAGPASLDTQLSLDQKIRIAEIVTNAEPRPLTDIHFTLAVGAAVPPDVQLHPLPPAAAKVASTVRGLDYLIVEEQIAFVEEGSRKIVMVFPRGRRQDAR